MLARRARDVSLFLSSYALMESARRHAQFVSGPQREADFLEPDEESAEHLRNNEADIRTKKNLHVFFASSLTLNASYSTRKHLASVPR